MIYTDMTKKAINIMFEAHKNQKDKSNTPYVFHPWSIAEKMTNEIETTTALLHDVAEDTKITIKDIEKEFSINRSTTSEMLKLMCKNVMITREEVDYDARLKKIVLTEASRQHNRNIEDKMRKMHQQLIKDLSDDEINAFIKISDKLINNIKEGL